MQDPLSPPPAIVVRLLRPFAQRYGLLTLPFHGHEIIGSFVIYSSVFLLISPGLSGRFVRDRYTNLSKRSQMAWHVRVVSTIQSTFICTIALYVLLVDNERQRLSSGGRLWAYSGASGMVQAFAAGYFLWDLSVSVRYFGILGASSLAHAVSALFITCIGFRPFANYYGLNFILYELSTPFLNIHWFLDKLGYTGTVLQLINGLCLIVMFFGCRLVWGSYQSWNLYVDLWSAWTDRTPAASTQLPAYLGVQSLHSLDHFEILKSRDVPAWFLPAYLVSNTLLSLLNFYWFGKMIQALRKRFTDPPKKTKQG